MEGAEQRMMGEDERCRITQLEEELEERDQKLRQAAMFGKCLLEENGDLRQQMDSLVKQQASALEEKQQEVCSLQSRIDVAASTEKWQQEETSNLRAELANLKEDMEAEKKRETAAHKKKVGTLHLDIERLQSVEQDLRRQIADLESLLQSHLDRTAPLSTSASFHTEEMATLAEELSLIKIDLTEAQAKTIDVSGQLQECQREKDSLSSRLRAAQAETEDLQCQVGSYSRHLEESRKEVLELRAQLDATRIHGQSHNSKGNSIFSELEDRRQTVEMMNTQLRKQNEQLKEKYNIEKQQCSKYKMQIAMALQMTGHKEDSSTQRLRDQLSEAHAEIRTLLDKVQDLQSSREVPTQTPEGGDKFFLATLQIEKDKATKAQNDLQAKSLQYLDVSRQNAELSRQAKQLQAEIDKTRSQFLKVLAEKEELIAKYEPERVKEGKLQKRVVEKIDIGDHHFQPRETCGRPSDIFKSCPTAGRPSDVFKPCSTTGRLSSVFKPCPPSGRLSSVFQPVSTKSGKSSSVLKPLNLERNIHSSDSQSFKQDIQQMKNFLKENFDESVNDISFAAPVGRTVKLSDDVQVIDADGQESKAVLTDERESTWKESVKKGKQAKAVKPVKCINADEGPQAECKTQ